MSHEITRSDGMFTVRLAAWHGLGKTFEDYPKREEAQAIAHPWEPEPEPLFRKVMRKDEETGEEVEVLEEAPGYVANVRDDNKSLLGVVKESYTPVLNTELWDVAEAIEGSGGDVMFETGGSLKGGSMVWVLLRLQEPIVVNGDPRGETIPYYALQNSHDGSGAFRGQATNTRIVCANTSKMADWDAQRRGTEFTFRHTKNVAERVEEAREALSNWRTALDEWKAQAEDLITRKLDDPMIAFNYLDSFIEMPPESLITERTKANVLRDRGKWLDAYNSVTGEGLKGTAYGLVQASIEFLEWGRKAHSNESRFRRSFLTRDKLTSYAIELALQATDAAYTGSSDTATAAAKSALLSS